MSGLSALLARLNRGMMGFAAAGLVAMTAIIAAQVFFRFVMGQSLAWSEQAAQFVLIWSVLPAAAAGVREGFHVRVSALTVLLGPAARRRLALLSHAIVGAFGLCMIVWGAELVVRTWPHIIPTLGLPRGSAYLPIPLAGLFIALFSAEQGWLAWRGAEAGAAWR